MAVYDVDLFVIGAGSGGVRAARVAAAHGAKVMIAEEFRIGGTCVIRGCVPKKLMVYASRYKDHFADAAGFGWNLAAPSFDWPNLSPQRKRKSPAFPRSIATISTRRASPSKTAARKSRMLIACVFSPMIARSSARIILVATGAAPVLEPDVPGREHAITSNEVFDLPELPKRMLIIGGGYIAVEFAVDFRAAWHRSVACRAGRKCVARIRRGYARPACAMGLRTPASNSTSACCPPHRENANGLPREFDERHALDADQVMIATGRRPNTSGLGLEKLASNATAWGR